MKLGSTQRVVLENVAARRAPYAGHKTYAEWTRRMDAANQFVKRGWLTRLPPGHPDIEGATSDAIAASMYKLTPAGRAALGGGNVHARKKTPQGETMPMPKTARQLDREIAQALSRTKSPGKASRAHARVAHAATTADAGFAIHTDHEDVIKDNARDHFGPDYGDAADRAKTMKAGLVDAAGKITNRGWEVLNKDFKTLENNSLAWLRKVFGRASDQGHDSSGDLIGSVSFNPHNATHAHNIVVGKNERVDFSDASYGDFARSGAWKGVSDFGQSVLGGHITFFDIQPPEAFEIAEETADKAAKRRRAARRR